MKSGSSLPSTQRARSRLTRSWPIRAPTLTFIASTVAPSTTPVGSRRWRGLEGLDRFRELAVVARRIARDAAFQVAAGDQAPPHLSHAPVDCAPGLSGLPAAATAGQPPFAWMPRSRASSATRPR